MGTIWALLGQANGKNEPCVRRGQFFRVRVRLTSARLPDKRDDVPVGGPVLVGERFHRDVLLAQVQVDALGEEEVGSVVLLEVVEDHDGAPGPVELRVQGVDEVPELGGGGSGPDHGSEFLAVVEAEREAAGRDKGELPVGREPAHGGHGVDAARPDEGVRLVVQLGVHGDDLSRVFGAGARGVLHAEVQELHGAAPQQRAPQDPLPRHAYGGQHAWRCPRVLQIVREHHGHGDVPHVRPAPRQHHQAAPHCEDAVEKLSFTSHFTNRSWTTGLREQ